LPNLKEELKTSVGRIKNSCSFTNSKYGRMRETPSKCHQRLGKFLEGYGLYKIPVKEMCPLYIGTLWFFFIFIGLLRT